jgi:D-alanyl-D-alanine carboxypeptidase
MLKQQNRFLPYAAIVVAVVLVVVGIMHVNHNNSTSSFRNASPPKPEAFNKTRYSINTASSQWVVVNKHRQLEPVDFTPQLATPNVPLRLSASYPEMQVSGQMVAALQQLFDGASKAGLNLMVASGYRSYQTQIGVYGAEVNRNGQAAADRESARPGYSEHQTGLAVDIEPANRQCEIEVCFGELPEGKWVAANAHKYGFIIRYQHGTEAVTGYTYEPWHIRYVGTELANELHRLGNPALETFFGVGAAPTYQ